MWWWCLNVEIDGLSSFTMDYFQDCHMSFVIHKTINNQHEGKSVVNF